MKESIFFNKEQIKIIRWYGLLYKTFFNYGIIIVAGFLSIVLSVYLLFSENFGLVKMLDYKDDYSIDKQSEINYQRKQSIAGSIPGLEAMVLNGKISYDGDSSVLSTQDVLLVNSGLVLPRLVDVSYSDLLFFIKGQSKKSYDYKYMNDFFSIMIARPLSLDSFGFANPKLLQLKGSLVDTFDLDCLFGSTKNSFICRAYIDSFLKNFYFYDLQGSSLDSQVNDSGIVDEVIKVFNSLKNEDSYKKRFCDGLLAQGKYLSVNKSYSEIFRECGSDYNTEFVLLRDFYSLTQSFSLGYSDITFYSNKILDKYKLFSLQQLLYKQLSSSADVKGLMQSYFGFIREVFVNEVSRNSTVFSPFERSFIYWYNMNILYPYLNDESSKMGKEDRTSLLSLLLSLNYGDKVVGFQGLQETSLYSFEETSGFEGENDKGQNLEELFKSSYMPPQFILIGLQEGENQTLIVKGKDVKTNLVVVATVKYENIQFFVSNVQVEGMEKLTDYINVLISNEKYSLNKVLNLVQENEKIGEETQLDLNLCVELENLYKEDLLECSSSEAKVLYGKGKSGNDGSPSIGGDIVYTFGFERGILSSVSISDKVLETKILNELDLSSMSSTSTLRTISGIVGYIPKDQDSGFGMKDYLLVTDRFSKYLGFSPNNVVSEGSDIKVYFSVEKIDFIGTYDFVTNELKPIALDFGTTRRPVIVQGLSLTLKDDQIEVLNSFVVNPLEYLRNLNPALVRKYFPDSKGK